MSFAPEGLRAVGKTALRVSQLGFGAAPFGNLMAEVTDEATRGSVDAALAAGIRYFDTAPFYGHGLSEHRLGEALRFRPRNSFVLSTKVGRLLKPDPQARTPGPFVRTPPFGIEYDYSRDGALRSFEDSLQRMGLARVDIVFIHDVTARWRGDALEATYRAAMEGAYRALADLRAQGTIGAIGVGVNDVDILRRFASDGDFDCFMLAGRYTLLDTTALPELLPLCERKSISILLAAPYHWGSWRAARSPAPSSGTPMHPPRSSIACARSRRYARAMACRCRRRPRSSRWRIRRSRAWRPATGRPGRSPRRWRPAARRSPRPYGPN